MCRVIVVDAESFRSTLSRMWCLYTWSCLDILITMRFSINCSKVICSPTVEFPILREATTETYGPRIYLPSYYFSINFLFLSLFILQSLFSNLYNKNTKNIYLTIFIRSHFRKWPWRDWQSLLSRCLRGSCLFVQVLGDLHVTSYWIDTLVLKN